MDKVFRQMAEDDVLGGLLLIAAAVLAMLPCPQRMPTFRQDGSAVLAVGMVAILPPFVAKPPSLDSVTGQ